MHSNGGTGLQRRRGVMWLCLALVCAVVAPSVRGMEAMPEVSLPREDWYRLELLGEHIGWMHLTSESASHDGRPAVRVRSELLMRLTRSGTPLELRRTRVVTFGAVPPFEFLRFEMTSNETGSNRLVEGWASGDTVQMATRIDGRSSAQTLELPPGTLFEEAIPFYLHARGFGIGESVEVSVFNGDLLRPLSDRIEAIRSETLELDGVPFATLRVSHRLDWMGGIETTDWIDADGSLARTEMETLGAPMAMVRTDRSAAVALGPTHDMDLMLATRLPLVGGTPTNAERFRARVRMSDGNLRSAVPDTSRQRLTLDPDGSTGALEVRRDTPPSEPSQFPDGEPSRSAFLTPTVYVESDDPTIREVARKIADGATDAWDAASRVNRWVYSHVTNKDLYTGFGTARQTLDSRSGDCTEHTVLAVALTRALGIPARLCSGVVWQKDGFYYHFWHEAYVGAWIAFDPTLGQTPADARRIQLSGGGLESHTVLELAEGVLRTLNRLSLKLETESE
ncbi:hypothetical protein FJZ36_07275 [Candidatus Poribacteria bacterium]|nr:hypothetical protein [Candidatus Poribacteria bacterium]